MAQRTLLAMVDIAHRDSAIRLCREANTQVRENDTLHVAYVMPYGHFSYIEPFVSEDSIKAAAKRAHEELSAICTESGLTDAVEHVLRGGVGEQALLLAGKLKANLILLNARRPDVKLHSLGAYATQVIRHAACSVFVNR